MDRHAGAKNSKDVRLLGHTSLRGALRGIKATSETNQRCPFLSLDGGFIKADDTHFRPCHSTKLLVSQPIGSARFGRLQPLSQCARPLLLLRPFLLSPATSPHYSRRPR